MSNPKPELVSFKLCPFVQRAVILLKEKNVDYDITYIDLTNKPDWFLKISPFGKVPVLKVGDDVIFESAVICEYLGETNPPTLHPEDAVQRAKNRAWIEFGSSLFMLNYQMSMAETEEVFKEKQEAMSNALSRLEAQFGDGPYFNGDKFTILDACLAPFFQRMFLIENEKAIGTFDNVPKMKAWGERLMQLETVKTSVVPEFDELFVDYLKNKEGSYLSNLLTA